jgi:hypothetical protein
MAYNILFLSLRMTSAITHIRDVGTGQETQGTIKSHVSFPSPSILISSFPSMIVMVKRQALHDVHNKAKTKAETMLYLEKSRDEPRSSKCVAKSMMK